MEAPVEVSPGGTVRAATAALAGWMAGHPISPRTRRTDMASPLDTRVGIGKEATYGTAVAPTRHFEARSDPWQRSVSRVDSSGFRSGRLAQRGDRDKQITLGATGSIETAFFTAGMGLLLENLLGSNVAPAQIGATGTYNASFAADGDGPSTSATVQVVRVLNGTERGFDYAGCVPTNFTLGVTQGEAVMLNVDYDARSEAKQSAPTAGTYVAADPFTWEECSVSIDGTVVGTFQSFNLDADLMLRTDLHFLQGTAVKDQPRRNAAPSFSGTLEGIPDDLDLFDKFADSETFPVVFSATNGGSGATLRSFTVTLPACKFTGSTPNAQLDGLTTQSIPFTAFHDGTAAPVTIATVSPDSAF